MKHTLSIYPKNCRKNIREIHRMIGVGEETAYSMILMTAALMDLRPDDEEVVEYILEDCGIYPEPA